MTDSLAGGSGHDPRAGGRVELVRDDYKSVAADTLAEIRFDDVPSLAAGVAFKIFLSLFPALAAAVAVFSLVTSPRDLDRVFARLSDFAPPAAVDVLQEPVGNLVTGDQGLAGSVLIVGVLGGLWAASSAAVTLMKALSRAYDVVETRKFAAQRVIALTITLALFLALVAIFLLLVVGSTIQDAVVARLEVFGPGQTALAVVLTVGRLVLAVVVLMVLFAFVYWIGPDRQRRPRWEWITAGAVVGVVGWLLLSFLFSLYVTNFGNYGRGSAYASFGAVVVLLLWLQLTMVALLMGGELNAVVRRLRDRRLAEIDAAGFADAAPVTPLEPGQTDAARDRLARMSGVPGSKPDVGAPDATQRGSALSSIRVAVTVGAVAVLAGIAKLTRRREPGA